MPEDMRTGNLQVDRTAWLISESKKLENFLKKKPANAGEIRATKDLWNKQANALQKDMTTEERVQANELADQLTERSLADYKAGKDTLKRGVVDFNVSKETDVTKLTDARTKLIDDWRAETDPDLKKAIAFTGKKVTARIEELNKPPVVSSVIENSTLAKVRPNELSGGSAFENLLNDITKNIENIKANPDHKFTIPDDPDSVLDFESLESRATNNSIMDYITSSENFKELESLIQKRYPVESSHPADVIYSRDQIEAQTYFLKERIMQELGHTETLQKLLLKPDLNDTLKLVEQQLEKIRNGKVCLAINGFDLEQVFKDKVFLNQFQTNTSRGSLNHSMRRKTEAIQHGTWLDALPGERAIYGYMAPTDADIVMKSVTGYGDFRIVFKPEVKSRSTFVYGDSLGESYIPVPVEGQLKLNQIYGAISTKDLETALPHIADVSPNKFNMTYPEAHIFGKLTPDDIESIYLVPSRFGENIVNLEQVNKLKDIFEKFGIKFANMVGN